MTDELPARIDCQRIELGGIRYVIVRETLFNDLCEKAGVGHHRESTAEEHLETGLGLDQMLLAEKLVRRRRAVGLSQVELARRAGVRPETLSRIERGHTTPDFATVRKLVTAMTAAERESLNLDSCDSHPSSKETNNASGK